MNKRIKTILCVGELFILNIRVASWKNKACKETFSTENYIKRGINGESSFLHGVRANIPWKMKWEVISDIIPMGRLAGIDPGGF